MLTDICAYLRNWFDRDQPKFVGQFAVEDGAIFSYDDEDMGIQLGQYYRVIGSVFNDGVWQYGTDNLKDEAAFDGAVWLMAVPSGLIDLMGEIKNWQEKYGGVDSSAMSPFTSESFAGYSYTKAKGGTSSDSSSATPAGWQDVFSARLARWKKI